MTYKTDDMSKLSIAGLLKALFLLMGIVPISELTLSSTWNDWNRSIRADMFTRQLLWWWKTRHKKTNPVNKTVTVKWTTQEVRIRLAQLGAPWAHYYSSNLVHKTSTRIAWIAAWTGSVVPVGNFGSKYIDNFQRGAWKPANLFSFAKSDKLLKAKRRYTKAIMPLIRHTKNWRPEISVAGDLKPALRHPANNSWNQTDWLWAMSAAKNYIWGGLSDKIKRKPSVLWEAYKLTCGVQPLLPWTRSQAQRSRIYPDLHFIQEVTARAAEARIPELESASPRKLALGYLKLEAYRQAYAKHHDRGSGNWLTPEHGQIQCARGEWYAETIPNASGLDVEAAYMDHCVYMYAADCGRSSVIWKVMFQDGDCTRRCTVEVRDGKVRQSMQWSNTHCSLPVELVEVLESMPCHIVNPEGEIPAISWQQWLNRPDLREDLLDELKRRALLRTQQWNTKKEKNACVVRTARRHRAASRGVMRSLPRELGDMIRSYSNNQREAYTLQRGLSPLFSVLGGEDASYQKELARMKAYYQEAPF